jgi:hypothetical protein
MVGDLRMWLYQGPPGNPRQMRRRRPLYADNRTPPPRGATGPSCLPSAPGLITSHPNPKRARSQIRREVTPEAFRARALLAAGRLAPRRATGAAELARTTGSALASDDRELVAVALYVACEHDVTIDRTRVAEPVRHPDHGVREAAERLLDPAA